MHLLSYLNPLLVLNTIERTVAQRALIDIVKCIDSFHHFEVVKYFADVTSKF